MNFINALGWSQWLFLLAIPPAVLSLYFLKLRRKPVEVPSTLLWRKSLEDLHVNSIWQRLRNSLLLYMQLLFLGLIIFACLRPGWSGAERIGEKRIYVLDQSASMSARDAEPNRLEAAKRAIRSLIDSSSDEDVGMLVVFSNRAAVQQGFTKDRNKLIAALESVSATNSTSNFYEALRVAKALAAPASKSSVAETDIDQDDTTSDSGLPAKVLVFSDGGFENFDDEGFEDMQIDFYSVGDAATENVAILGFAVQAKEGYPDQMEAFARLANYGGTEVSCTASLEIDGELVDATTVKVASNAETGVVFELSSLQEGELKLSLDHVDANQIDNVAYAAVRPPRRIKVLLVSNGNSALEAAMKTDRCRQISDVEVENIDYLATAEYEARERQGDFELVIFDRCAPKTLPMASTLFVGVLPPKAKPQDQSTEPQIDESNFEADESKRADEWRAGEATGPVLIVDVDRSHPITEYLEMNSVIIVEGMTVAPPEGGKILMSSDSGPVFAISPRGPFQDAVLGFSLAVNENTDWGLRRSFPVFVYSSIESLGGGSTETAADSVRPGDTIRIGLAPQILECILETPSGARIRLTRASDSSFLFSRTEEIGIYKIYSAESDDLLDKFCVNLFSNRESDIRAANSIELGAKAVAAETSVIRSRQEVWRWLLFAGLALLIMEWGIFNRRVFA